MFSRRFAGGSAATLPFESKTASFAASSNTGYVVGALAANCTITLPASPGTNDSIVIIGPLDTTVYSCTINGNGKNISAASTRTMTNGEAVLLFYSGTEWRIVDYRPSDVKLYTPTWTQSGGSPAVGNGSLQGSYCRVGDLVHVVVRLLVGATTNKGTGTSPWLFSLPPGLPGDTTKTALANAGTTANLFNAVQNSVAGAITYGRCVMTTQTSGLDAVQFVTSAGANVHTTAPVSWATNDILQFSISYPVT